MAENSDNNRNSDPNNRCAQYWYTEPISLPTAQKRKQNKLNSRCVCFRQQKKNSRQQSLKYQLRTFSYLIFLVFVLLAPGNWHINATRRNISIHEDTCFDHFNTLNISLGRKYLGKSSITFEEFYFCRFIFWSVCREMWQHKTTSRMKFSKDSGHNYTRNKDFIKFEM